MKKLVGAILSTVLLISFVSVIVYGVMLFISLFKSPQLITEQSPDLSIHVTNNGMHNYKIAQFDFHAGTKMVLTRNMSDLFITLKGDISKNNKAITVNNFWKLENSIYGKYGRKISSQKWNNIIGKIKLDDNCSSKVSTLFFKRPSNSLTVEIADNNNSSFGHIFSIQKNKMTLEETYRKYSSKGSSHFNIYNCNNDAQSQLLMLLEQLIMLVE